MRRTYRSKKDTGGALDHRDMLLNMDEKSSAFDAFYIENLKQTKRELSCIAPSNQAKIISNKVRKRKYVKRLVTEPVRQRETSTSGYLTPDKSIRVNKILDPFDMLLNSTPALREPSKPGISEAFGQKKESKTYQRKRKSKIKKFNASLDSTGSQKENTTDPNTTDLGTHELLIEKVPNSNKFSKCVDESINKIISNLSLINNLKRKGANGSFNTSYKTKNRLTKNYQSPLMQKSPYCSTPFNEKYRGVSIYNLSPITQREQINSTWEDKDESNHSIILVSKSLALKKTNEFEVSPLIQIPNITTNKNKTNVLVNHSGDNSSIVVPEVAQNEIETFDSQNQNDISISINEHSSCQITDTEPFLGFSNNGANNFTKENLGSMLACLDNPSLHYDFGGNELVTNNRLSSNINTDEKNLGTNKSKYNNSSIHDTDGNYIATKSDLDGSLSNTDNDSENSSSNIGISRIDRKGSNKKKTFDTLSVNFNQNELDSNNTSNDESKNATNYSIDSNKCNTSESKTLSQSSDSESLYDTCSSDQSSILDDENRTNKELIVAIEKMNESIFLKYYAKMLNSQDKEMGNQTNNENVISFASDSNAETLNQSGENTDSDQIKAIIINDSFTTDDVAEDLNNDEKSNDVNERYISFVTTRRRNEVPQDSMFQFDQSYGSSSTDCDKTVLSIDINIVKPSDNIYVENVSESNLSEINIDSKRDYKDLKTDSVQNKIILRKSRNSRLLDKNDATSPLLHHDFKFRNPAKDICMINTRRGSRISRQGNATNIVGPIFDMKLFENQTNKRISRISMRKSSKITRPSHFTCEEDDYNGKKIFKNVDESDKTVIENNISDKNCIDFQIRDSNSPLPAKQTSYTLKENIVSRPERLSFVGADVKPAIVLHPGKKWERSLSIYRRMTMVADHCDQSVLEDDCKQNKGRKYRQSVISTMEMQEYKDSLHNDSINSRRSTFVSNPGRPSIRFVKDPNFSRVSLNTSSVFDDLKGFLSEECDDTVIELSKLSIAGSEREVTILDNFHETERVTTARDYVLRRCNQTEPLLFDECFPETVLKNCHKIGEGVYGEVFLWRGRDGRARVMKIVPIAGTVKVNGEHQKDFHEIISEIVIAMELSALRAPIADIERQLDEGNDINAVELHAIENATDIFNEVLAVRCVFGPYPSRLLDLWELYDECKGSENDNPASLPADQRYIVLELANAGQDLESYQFASAQQAHALFQQIAFGLAVAEEAFQFEHRDLHWGNVLIAPTEQKFATFVLRGRTYRVPRRGVAATVIDYSLSRLSLPLAGECAALYNDLAADEQLFDAVGDYQFELYRLMRDKLGNDWKNFEPYTNILWLHYTVDKMITALRYKRTNTKIHKHYIEKLKGIKNSILEYGSTVQYVLTDIEF